MSEYRPAFVARKGNPGFGWVVDVLWPDGETEVVKGFATEQQAAGLRGCARVVVEKLIRQLLGRARPFQ
jgi:hypothetical protein